MSRTFSLAASGNDAQTGERRGPPASRGTRGRRERCISVAGSRDEALHDCWTLDLLAHTEFAQALVVDAEVVAELVEDRLADLLADIVVGRADGLDVLLVEGDSIGHHEVVVLAALRQGDALVEAEEEAATPDARSLAFARGGAALDRDVDVVDSREDFRGDLGDRLANQLAEVRALQDLPQGGRGAPQRAEALATDGGALFAALEFDELPEGGLGLADSVDMATLRDALDDFGPDARGLERAGEARPPDGDDLLRRSEARSELAEVTVALFNRLYRHHDLHHGPIDLGGSEIEEQPVAERDEANCDDFATSDRLRDIDKVDAEVVVHNREFTSAFPRNQPGNSPPSGHELATKTPAAGTDNNGEMLPFFRRQSTQERVERLIREGVGVREAAWELVPVPERNRDLSSDIVTWVRRVMGEMRRPYGIDHVALALAARDQSGRVLCTNSLGVVRPASFYSDDGVSRVRAFLDDAVTAGGEQSVRISAALLSLGDLAFELNLARAA